MDLESARAYLASFPSKLTYAHRLSIDEDAKNEDGIISVLCFKCKTRFIPSYNQIISRIYALNGLVRGGELHIYCSQECKNNCDTYHKSKYFKHQIPLASKVRCNQYTDKQALLNNQLDQYGYNYCEKCGNRTTNLIIHHNLRVSQYPTEADNVAHQLLVCKQCHTHERC